MEDNNRLNNQISKDNNTNIIDDSVNNSSTSEDSGIFSSINLGNESEIQTPSTSPPRRPIYAPETTKGDSVFGDTSKRRSPHQFDFENNLSKTNISKGSSSNNSRPTYSTPSSPSNSTSSEDSSMLDMISRAAIYDEIYKLDD